MSLDSPTREKSVQRRLNKITLTNLEVMSYELMTEPVDTVIWLSYELLVNKPNATYAFYKLFNNMNIDLSAYHIKKYSQITPEKKGYSMLLLVIFYNIFPKVSLASFLNELDSDEDRGKFLWSMWEQQEGFENFNKNWKDFNDKFNENRKDFSEIVNSFSLKELDPRIETLIEIIKEGLIKVKFNKTI
jgi:hypothetical protein